MREVNPDVRANLMREAQARGIEAERLVFAPPVKELQDHLARQQLADIFLDTLYYNAHATASDALWCGVPIVTCPGPAFAGRVAASLLTAVGLQELLARSLEEYEMFALKLANDRAYFSAIKAKLASNRNTCPLFDTARITRHLERAYEIMWQRQQHGEKPESFAVDPL
jgi:protein O-GlcNAc transferase